MSEATQYAEPSPEIAALVGRVERFDAACRPAHDSARLASDLVHLRHVIDVLEVAFSERAAAFDLTNEFQEWGSVSSEDWIRHHCDMSRTAVADRVTVGHHRAKLTRSVEALSEREIGFAHLSLIARTHDAVGDCAVSEELEGQLLARAMDMSVGAFRYFCQHARHAADSEAVNSEHVDAVEQRKLRFSNWGQHVVLISGQLDSVGAAALKTALMPLARKRGKHDHRNRDRRLADGLVDLATTKLDRPQLQVTTSLETLLGLAGSPAAELELSAPISARTLERLACDCSISRVLLDSDSLVIDVGRSKRVISGPQKRALRARDKHCRWPGCDRAATYTEGHHLVHWSRGGRTDLPNLVLLCYRHHWMVHEGEWQLVLSEDGRLRPIKPLEKIFWRRPRAPAAWAA